MYCAGEYHRLCRWVCRRITRSLSNQIMVIDFESLRIWRSKTHDDILKVHRVLWFAKDFFIVHFFPNNIWFLPKWISSFYRCFFFIRLLIDINTCLLLADIFLHPSFVCTMFEMLISFFKISRMLLMYMWTILNS